LGNKGSKTFNGRPVQYKYQQQQSTRAATVEVARSLYSNEGGLAKEPD